MRVLISSESDEQINALYRWFQADDDVARSARVSIGRPRELGSMGALETIDVVLTHAVAIGNLALAFMAFRQSRTNSSPLTITRPDGQTLTTDGSPEVTSEVITRFLSGGNDGAGDQPQPEG
jgi:hypothetical protein